LLDSLLQEILMLVLSGEAEGDFLYSRRYSVIEIFSRKFLNNSQSPRPHCVIPATSGLKQERRPTWLALIIFFFSDRMKEIWARLATGIVIGLVCDQLTNTDQFFTRL